MNRRFSAGLTLWSSVALCAAQCLATTGCGDSSETIVDGGTASGGGGSDPGGSGGGGSPANAGSSGGTAGAGGMEAPVICGADTCTSSFFLKACCTKAKQCGRGTQDECLELNQEGTLDTRCADQALIAFGSVAKGCCKANGQCGLLLTGQGLGCVERSQMPSWASGGAKWTAAACSDADAGAID
jgi:hypothetical protein